MYTQICVCVCVCMRFYLYMHTTTERPLLPIPLPNLRGRWSQLEESCAKCDFLCEFTFLNIFWRRIGLFSFSNFMMLLPVLLFHIVSEKYGSFLSGISCFCSPPLLLSEPYRIFFISVISICSILILPLQWRPGRMYCEWIEPCCSSSAFRHSNQVLSLFYYSMSKMAPGFIRCSQFGHLYFSGNPVAQQIHQCPLASLCFPYCRCQ